MPRINDVFQIRAYLELSAGIYPYGTRNIILPKNQSIFQMRFQRINIPSEKSLAVQTRALLLALCHAMVLIPPTEEQSRAEQALLSHLCHGAVFSQASSEHTFVFQKG